MGGHPYQYVVPYQDNVQAALDRLREDVFQRGNYYGAETRPASVKDALERAGESGTRSILDIERIAKKPALRCAAPLTPEELSRYFGDRAPTIDLVEQCDQLWEELERGMARYVLTYEDGTPASLVFVGYSFD